MSKWQTLKKSEHKYKKKTTNIHNKVILLWPPRMCIAPRCAARGPLFAAAALGGGGPLADAALCTLGTSSWAAGAAACGRDKKKIEDILAKSQAGAWGGVLLFWRPPMYSCCSFYQHLHSWQCLPGLWGDGNTGLALESGGRVWYSQGFTRISPVLLFANSWHIALLWVTASGAPRRNPSACFLPSIPLC